MCLWKKIRMYMKLICFLVKILFLNFVFRKKIVLKLEKMKNEAIFVTKKFINFLPF